jgi:Domain of unknown function (DUF4386)
MHLSDAHHFRKLVAGACMVVAPLFLLVATVVHPDVKTDEAAQLAVIADNLDAWIAAHMFALVSLALAVPAVLGLMHMLREREVSLGHVGGGLAMLGLLAYVGVVAIEGFVGWQMGEAGDRAAMVALLTSINDSAAIVTPFFVGSLAFAVGMVGLAIGLYRARAVQSWMAICLAVGAVLLAISGPAAATWVAIVAAAFLVVGLGSIGAMVYRESDEAWEHTPEYEGFRPVPGMR